MNEEMNLHSVQYTHFWSYRPNRFRSKEVTENFLGNQKMDAGTPTIRGKLAWHACLDNLTGSVDRKKKKKYS